MWHLLNTCSDVSSVSSSVWVLLSRLIFCNKRGVEKQKRTHRKYWMSVRPQSEKYHSKPRVSAMQKRHRYMFPPSRRFAFYNSGRWLWDMTCARLVAHIVFFFFFLSAPGKKKKKTVFPFLRKWNSGRKSTLLNLSKLWLAAGNPRVVVCNRTPSTGDSLTWQQQGEEEEVCLYLWFHGRSWVGVGTKQQKQ